MLRRTSSAGRLLVGGSWFKWSGSQSCCTSSEDKTVAAVIAAYSCKQLQVKPPPPKKKKKSWAFKEIWTHGHCISTTVLYQLNYENPFFGKRPICWVHFNLWKLWNILSGCIVFLQVTTSWSFVLTPKQIIYIYIFYGTIDRPAWLARICQWQLLLTPVTEASTHVNVAVIILFFLWTSLEDVFFLMAGHWKAIWGIGGSVCWRCEGEHECTQCCCICKCL